MKDLSLEARLYVTAVIGGGLWLVLACVPRARFDDPLLFGVLLLLASLTSTFKVHLPLSNSGSSLSVSYAVDFVSLLLLGPDETMIVAATSAWSQCAFRTKQRPATYRTLFSMACLIVTVQAAGWVYASAGGRHGSWAPAQFARPLVSAATAYFFINTITIAVAIALSTRQPVLRIWKDNFMWSAPSYFAGAVAAAIAAVLIDRAGHWIAPLAVVPLYLTYRTYDVYVGRIEEQQRHLEQVSELHLATVEALARAVDAKDQTSHTHIRRVQIYAAALAKAAGVTAWGDLQSIKTAALLHDIGKVAVPEHILTKPGPLTEEEFRKIRTHPAVGAEIVAAVPFPYPVAPLIRHHHERWDGRGYPNGLAGEAIPLGARILAVADSYEALMAERPYHKAMPCEGALAVLRAEAGKGLDPALVEIFIPLAPQLEAEVVAAERAADADVSPTGPAAHAHADSQPSRPPDKTVFDDIAHAHREIYALYEIAHAMGMSLGVSDTMTLIASKLTTLVPFSACALFLYDDGQERLRCRFASGVAADRLRVLEVERGKRLDRPAELGSALVLPLIVRDQFIGTLSVFHVEPHFYRDDHRRLMERVCEQAAAVINNSIVFEQTQEESLSDPLTALPNTRHLFKYLAGELSRASRLNHPLALMVMDLDGFKDINDHHGHHVGDRALCQVARVLQSAIRPYDICVRYAGDEFIIVLSECGAEEADAKRRMLQEAIDALELEARPGKRLRLGVSVGTAVFPADGASYEALLAAADRRMYQDKTTRGAGRRQERSSLSGRCLLRDFRDTDFASTSGFDVRG